MNINKWLTINSRGITRLTQGKPSTNYDEISILLDINLPNELFRKPRLEARIEIPKEAAGPDVLSSEVIENVKEVIQQTTGLTFSINVIKNEEEEKQETEST
jgi:hypothetical protein